MKLVRGLLILGFALGASSASFAQQNTTASPATSMAVSVEKPPAAGLSSVLLGFKSYNSSGRFGAMNEDALAPSKGQVYNGKQEAFLGYKFANQWGGFFQVSQTRLQYNDSTLNRWSMGDPSVTLLHPDLFDNGTVRVRGQARVYIPTTDRSRSQNIRQYAYYSSQTFALGNGQEIFNQVIPRYFQADRYGASDTTFYVENRTIYTKKINSWCKLGLGNWFQMEQHAATPTGYSSEVIPQVDFLVSSNITFGPRVAFPIYAKEAVYDGPKNATIDQARGELFFQATL